MKTKNMIMSLTAALLVIGCAGREAYPVMIQQYGDEKKSCQALERDMAFIQGEIQRLVPQSNKTGKNVALGVTGYLFVVPLLFMDLSKAERIEIDAYRKRYNHLLIIAGDKQCEIEGKAIPESTSQEEPEPMTDGE